MSKSNVLENALLDLLFNATAIPNVADDAASAPLTNLYVSLHTSDPGEAGTQETNEAAYTSYARVAVSRDSGGWTVSGNAVENTATVQFPEATGGSETITHFGIGSAASGAGVLYYSGALTASLAVSSGIQPQFNAGDIDISED